MQCSVFGGVVDMSGQVRSGNKGRQRHPAHVLKQHTLPHPTPAHPTNQPTSKQNKVEHICRSGSLDLHNEDAKSDYRDKHVALAQAVDGNDTDRIGRHVEITEMELEDL